MRASPVTIADRKAALRREALAARDVAHATVDPAPALETLEAILTRHPGARVAGYLAIRTELDPAPLLARLHARGHPVCLPVVEARAAPLVFRDWHPGLPLEAGVFGTRIPPAGESVVPDIVIAPLVAFDGACRRLGYGGGYYDRSLAALRVPALGLAYAAQCLAQVPAEQTDVPLDAVVTEAGLHATPRSLALPPGRV